MALWQLIMALLSLKGEQGRGKMGWGEMGWWGMGLRWTLGWSAWLSRPPPLRESLLGYREAWEERTWTMRERERVWVAKGGICVRVPMSEGRRGVKERVAVLVYLATLGPGSDLVRRSDTTGQPEPTRPALYMWRGHCPSRCAMTGPQKWACHQHSLKGKDQGGVAQIEPERMQYSRMHRQHYKRRE